MWTPAIAQWTPAFPPDDDEEEEQQDGQLVDYQGEQLVEYRAGGRDGRPVSKTMWLQGVHSACFICLWRCPRVEIATNREKSQLQPMGGGMKRFVICIAIACFLCMLAEGKAVT